MVDQWFKKVDVFRPVTLAPGQGHLRPKPAVKGPGIVPAAAPPAPAGR
jgi:hypothetical protein